MACSNPPPVDVAALVHAGEALSGATPLVCFERLRSGLASLPPQADAAWRVQGLWREAGAWGRQPALRLRITATLPMTCQRCLQAVAVPLAVDRHFVFAPDEAAAARWDAELDEDVLVLEHPVDLAALIEDELIMATPQIPRHERCARPPSLATRSDGFDAAAPAHPFAALAGYRRRGWD